ncbi:AAA family ATPase, partial [Halobellus sp. Atlit-38R]
MKLTVKPLKQKDAGRRLAAIDRVAAEELGLSGGDIVRVEGGDGAAIARVWPGYPEDDGTGVIRIDGRLRQEADVGIDDRVTVEDVDVSRADAVTIAFPSQLRVRGQIAP